VWKQSEREDGAGWEASSPQLELRVDFLKERASIDEGSDYYGQQR